MLPTAVTTAIVGGLGGAVQQCGVFQSWGTAVQQASEAQAKHAALCERWAAHARELRENRPPQQQRLLDVRILRGVRVG